MSDIWLGLALVGTFFTVFLFGVVVDMLMRERHRPVSILQAQVGQVPERQEGAGEDGAKNVEFRPC